MKAKALQTVAKIATKISNPSSLTSLFRSIQIGPELVQCCSEYGNIEIKMDPTGLQSDLLVDTNALLAIAQSVSGDSDIAIEEKDNRLSWSCNEVKGHLNQVVTDNKIPKIEHAQHPWEPPQDFGMALLLASSACQAAAVSFGLYGITMIEEGDRLEMMSSNTISLACSAIAKGDYSFGKVTVRPPVPAIIASLLSVCSGCKIDITPDGIFIQGDWLKARLPLGVNLDHDLKEIVKNYSSANTTALINSKAVKRFITRAKQLSDKNATFNVQLRTENGKLALIHNGITSSTEEFFLADGLDTALNFESVSIPAEMLLLPLESIETIVFDYLSEKNLVLRGSKPDFVYVIGGA